MSHSVAIPHDDAFQAVLWSQQYCPSYITNKVKFLDHNTDDRYFLIEFFFVEEKDATMFALRWK